MSTEVRIREDFRGLIRHPSVILITGGKGSGKSVIAHKLAEDLHNKGHKVVFLCPKKIREKMEKDAPWIQLESYRKRIFPGNSVIIFDDAQLKSHAREWYKRTNIRFDKLISLSRHKKSTLLLATQETYRLDRNIVGSVDLWLHKKPSLLGARMERREVRDITKTVAEEFHDLEDEGKDPLKYIYCIHDTYMGFIGPYDPPSYWSEEISEW